MISLAPTPESRRAVARVLDMACTGMTPAAVLVVLGLSWTDGAAPTWGQVVLTYGFHLERLAACEAPAVSEKNKPRKVRASGAGVRSMGRNAEARDI